jgi:hypothetical protein
MGIGPKVPIEGDLLISTQQPKYMVKSNGTVQVHSLTHFLILTERSEKSKNQPEKLQPQSHKPISQTNLDF